MRPLREHVLANLRAHGLWEPGHKVAVAVSGGLDSVVLLHLLHATAGVHRALLSVVTVDHGVRDDSDRDAAFVVELAEGLGLPWQLARATPTETSEQALREARYACFEALPVDRVALAHHRNDQAETVLINLLRGTGPAGLRGMAWRRGSYVRPLLDVPREALEEVARAEGLAWREDPSNRSPRYLRNRVRHEVLPLLEEVRPGSSAALARSAALLAEQQHFIDALLADAPRPLTVAWLRAVPPPLARHALLQQWPVLTTAQVREVLSVVASGSGKVTLSAALSVKVEGDSVVLFDVR